MPGTAIGLPVPRGQPRCMRNRAKRRRNHEAEPGSTSGALERRALEDGDLRLDRVRGRRRRDRRRGRHEAAGRGRGARRVRSHGVDPRRQLPAPGGGERPRGERHAHREEPGLRCRRGGRRRTGLGDPGGDESAEPARPGQRRPGLGGRPLGRRPVRHPRRPRRRGGQDRARRRGGGGGEGRSPRPVRRELRRDHGRRGDHGVSRQGPRASRPTVAAGDARRPRARLRRARRGGDPAAARAHSRDRNHGPPRPAESRLARGRERERGRAADRARGRRRLLALLLEARARGTSGRAE